MEALVGLAILGTGIYLSKTTPLSRENPDIKPVPDSNIPSKGVMLGSDRLKDIDAKILEKSKKQFAKRTMMEDKIAQSNKNIMIQKIGDSKNCPKFKPLTAYPSVFEEFQQPVIPDNDLSNLKIPTVDLNNPYQTIEEIQSSAPPQFSFDGITDSRKPKPHFKGSSPKDSLSSRGMIYEQFSGFGPGFKPTVTNKLVEQPIPGRNVYDTYIPTINSDIQVAQDQAAGLSMYEYHVPEPQVRIQPQKYEFLPKRYAPPTKDQNRPLGAAIPTHELQPNMFTKDQNGIFSPVIQEPLSVKKEGLSMQKDTMAVLEERRELPIDAAVKGFIKYAENIKPSVKKCEDGKPTYVGLPSKPTSSLVQKSKYSNDDDYYIYKDCETSIPIKKLPQQPNPYNRAYIDIHENAITMKPTTKVINLEKTYMGGPSKPLSLKQKQAFERLGDSFEISPWKQEKIVDTKFTGTIPNALKYTNPEFKLCATNDQTLPKDRNAQIKSTNFNSFIEFKSGKDECLENPFQNRSFMPESGATLGRITPLVNPTEIL